MYQIHYTGQFKKDLRLIKKRSVNEFKSLRVMVNLIEAGGHQAVPQNINHIYYLESIQSIGNAMFCQICFLFGIKMI